MGLAVIPRDGLAKRVCGVEVRQGESPQGVRFEVAVLKPYLELHALIAALGVHHAARVGEVVRAGVAVTVEVDPGVLVASDQLVHRNEILQDSRFNLQYSRRWEV